MNRYIITIEETCSDTFCVEADSPQNAMKTARAKYSSGEYVLEPGNLVHKQMKCDCHDTNESTEWMDF